MGYFWIHKTLFEPNRSQNVDFINVFVKDAFSVKQKINVISRTYGQYIVHVYKYKYLYSIYGKNHTCLRKRILICFTCLTSLYRLPLNYMCSFSVKNASSPVHSFLCAYSFASNMIIDIMLEYTVLIPC